MSTNVELPVSYKRALDTETSFKSFETAEDKYKQSEEDKKKLGALENASRLFGCAWNGCDATLGSWYLLKRHVDKMHCEVLSHRDKTLGGASSSRAYRCRYASCQNRTFLDPSLLLDHIVTGHLETIKLRCPLGCKQNLGNLHALSQHLSSAHGKIVTELPGARMCLPPPRRASLPELATEVPMSLEFVAQVKPCPTFDATKVKRKSRTDPWADFTHFDGEDETPPFSQLRLLQDKRVANKMRPTPRGQIMYDDLQQAKAVVSRMQGESVGYESWKRRFEEEAEATEAPGRSRPGTLGRKKS